MQMAPHKSIEQDVAEYIVLHYRRAVEIGPGRTFTAARILHNSGRLLTAVDIHPCTAPPGVPFVQDDIWNPLPAHYTGADVLYAIRPGYEILPSIIRLGKEIGADVIVYHLGFETWGDGGEIIRAGQIFLHRYYQVVNPSKRVF